MARQKQKATQLYVGKIFSLKNHRRIFTSLSTTKSSDELGPNVIVMDETGKDVEIFTADYGPVWVSKYYLHSEIREMLEGNVEGEVGKIITELGGVRESLGNCDVTVPKATMKYVEKSLKTVEKLIRRLRVVQETLESKSKSG